MTFELDNKRGVATHYGTRVTDGRFGGEMPDDIEKYASWTFTYDKLPGDGFDGLVRFLPAGAAILEAYFQVITPFTGSSGAFDIDFVNSAGAAIGTGSDKLWDALLLAEIDSSAVGTALKSSTHTGTNSGKVLIGKALGAECILSAAGQLKVAVSAGSFTAGKARLIVRYLDTPAS